MVVADVTVLGVVAAVAADTVEAYSRSNKESIDEFAEIVWSSLRSAVPSSSEGDGGEKSRKETGGAGADAATG